MSAGGVSMAAVFCVICVGCGCQSGCVGGGVEKAGLLRVVVGGGLVGGLVVGGVVGGLVCGLVCGLVGGGVVVLLLVLRRFLLLLGGAVGKLVCGSRRCVIEKGISGPLPDFRPFNC